LKHKCPTRHERVKRRGCQEIRNRARPRVFNRGFSRRSFLPKIRENVIKSTFRVSRNPRGRDFIYITCVYSKLRRHLDDGACSRPRRNSRRLRAYVHRARSREEKKKLHETRPILLDQFLRARNQQCRRCSAAASNLCDNATISFSDAIKNYNLYKIIINNGLLFIIRNIYIIYNYR
jgi:hypothetical protein